MYSGLSTLLVLRHDSLTANFFFKECSLDLCFLISPHGVLITIHSFSHYLLYITSTEQLPSLLLLLHLLRKLPLLLPLTRLQLQKVIQLLLQLCDEVGVLVELLVGNGGCHLELLGGLVVEELSVVADGCSV